MVRFDKLLMVTLMALGVSGCGRASNGGDALETSAALKPLTACADVEAALRAAALREMNSRLDAVAEQLAHGGRCYEDDAQRGGTVNASPPTGGGAKQVSGTNNQVADVDEADFVKNDDEFIYVVSDGALRIIDAWPAREAHELAKVDLEGTPKKLFVGNDRAVVYSALAASSGSAPNGAETPYAAPECTYGYDCDFSGDGSHTRVSVFDIADRAAPKLIREMDLSGSYIAARRVDGSVFTVVHEARTTFDGVKFWPDGISSCAPPTDSMRVALALAELRRKNAHIIRTAPLSDWLPSLRDTHFEGGAPRSSSNLLASCQGFYDSPRADGSGFITLVGFSLQNAEHPSTSTVVSRPGAVYASSDALYLAVRQNSAPELGWYRGMEGERYASTLHKFALDSRTARARYAASGVVKGFVLNQFALDEWQDHLRVATSSGHVPDPKVHSTLTVLEQRDSALVETGRVDQIAPTEDIRSVRFAEDKAFVVTFKKTDPLYSFDLKDPERPRILGELKIPGFSTYMHMLDDTHLLTIGYDADDQGDFAFFQGILLQIFDVTNARELRLLHKELIGTRGSSSEALTNHLAFNYFAPLSLLAFPATICEGGASGSFGTTMTFSGLLLYDVATATGFRQRGRVVHPSDPVTGMYDDTACSNWWTQASSSVKRSIVMDDFVFSVSEQLIKVNALANPSLDVVAIRIAE
ncbi:MAG TPA: beta-propeller domain-containing protein [Polyangiaceae bacterium]